MKNNIFLKVFLFIVCITLISGYLKNVNAQSNNITPNDTYIVKLIGTWSGNLIVDSTLVPLVFKVNKDSSNILKVTLDSPLQNAFNVPLGELSITQSEIKIDAPYLAAYYVGRFTDDLTIKGTWNQATYSFPLTLFKKS